MRYRRLLHRDVCLATDVGRGESAGLTTHFFCPACGSTWGRLEADTENSALPVRHYTVNHYCSCSPTALHAYSGDPRFRLPVDLRIPGSFFPTHFQWWTEAEMGRLLLTHPNLADYERHIHLRALNANP